MMQAPLAVLGLHDAQAAQQPRYRWARILGRNYPLVLLLVLIGALFWPTQTKTEDAVAGAEGTEQKPNGLQPAETFH